MRYLTKLAMGIASLAAIVAVLPANAAPVTDPDDARTWQGAGVGTFAELFHGSNTPANRALVTGAGLLDDGIFDPTGYVAGALISGGGGCLGTSLDLTGTGDLGYICGGGSIATYANAIDNLWFQTDGFIGGTVFDLGFSANKAAVFNSIDHGPLPGEAIESTVYLSDSIAGFGGTLGVDYFQAVTEKVFLEGFMANTGILWDGFSYVVGTGTSDTFRYASIIHGGPGALRDDGDDEINGIMGLSADGTGLIVPEPVTLSLLGAGLLGIGAFRRRRA